MPKIANTFEVFGYDNFGENQASLARMCKQLVVAIEVVDAVEDGFPVGDELADRARVGTTLSRPYRRRAQKRLSGLEERAQILLSPSVENQ